MARVNIEDCLYSYLAGQAPLTSLVGGRIAPVGSPQGTAFPRLAFEKHDGSPDYIMSGESGVYTASFTIECQALHAVDAESVRNAVLDALSGYQGMLCSLWCQSSFCTSDRDQFYPPVHADQAGIHAKLLEFDLTLS